MKIKLLLMLNTFLMISSLIALIVTAILDKNFWWIFTIVILTLDTTGMLLIDRLERY